MWGGMGSQFSGGEIEEAKMIEIADTQMVTHEEDRSCPLNLHHSI